MALLLLAHAARPGSLEAATVDHGLRPESADEARMVADLCAEIGVPHAILRVEVAEGNLQANARAARYAALGRWMDDHALDALLTAHHADDQAETLVMRLNRGSGLAGLAGVRALGEIPGHGGILARPLLDWRKAELERLVSAAGIAAVLDPSNENDEFDRVRMRKALAEADWLDQLALARSASHLSDALAALERYATDEWENCVEQGTDGIVYRPAAPRMVRLMVLQRAFAELGGEPRGGALSELLDALEAGRGGNLAGILATAEKTGWVLRREPPRR
ncbi:tRNA lysidine(34) synthetase TilS [Altererythrobacter arenosus]|uniref:tRNA lysidine(34) synthetase TilS n=1 Tax=Altererythrobacter arenosus TaxID=3032592 RepID=UPI0032429140